MGCARLCGHGATSRSRSAQPSHANAACGARAAYTAQAGGASVQLLAERRAESASLNKNREALYALAQAGRRGVRVDGTRQVQ